MIWLQDGDEIPDWEKHMIQSQKLMLTFFWNSYGFQVVDAMPKGEMFTAAYYIRNILTAIVACRGERGERRLVVHAENARPHTAKVTRAFYDGNFMRIASHPCYSPDLTF
jgi:hypothetical protein